MSTQYLELTDGRLAYEDTGGTGPLVVCAPGMGDTRKLYRFLAPQLRDAGYRVVTVDLRGQGESSVGWSDYGPRAIGGDLVALVRHLDAGPAALIGESMAAASAVWVAAEAPELITGIALSGPFARDLPLTAVQKFALRLVGRSAALWTMYYKTLYPGQKPADFAEYRRALKANLSEPGRLAALRGMLLASKADCAARISEVRCPALVLMGTKDPDFPDPTGEARTLAELLSAEVVLFDGAGHYPPAEQPAETAAALLPFLARVTRVA